MGFRASRAGARDAKREEMSFLGGNIQPEGFLRLAALPKTLLEMLDRLF